MIVVYRDPRDQMAEIIRQKHLFLHMRSPTADIYGGDRIGALKFQIHTLETRLSLIDKVAQKHGAEKVKLISFENFIQQNNLYREKLEGWIGLSSKEKTRSILEPSVSVKNIGIYKDHLTVDELSLVNPLYENYLNRIINEKL